MIDFSPTWLLLLQKVNKQCSDNEVTSEASLAPCWLGQCDIKETKLNVLEHISKSLKLYFPAKFNVLTRTQLHLGFNLESHRKSYVFRDFPCTQPQY